VSVVMASSVLLKYQTDWNCTLGTLMSHRLRGVFFASFLFRRKKIVLLLDA
jgi:hypothetical protein